MVTFVVLGLVFYVGLSVGRRVTPEAMESTETKPPTPIAEVPVEMESADYQFYEHLDQPVPERGVARNQEIAQKRQEVIERKAKKEKRKKGTSKSPSKDSKPRKSGNKETRAQPERPQVKQRSLERNAPAEEVLKEQPRTKTLSRSSSTYTMQVSAFRSRDQAFSLEKELKQSGYPAFVVSEEIPGQGKWYRVRIGRYSSRQEAITAKKKFEGNEGRRVFITKM